MATASQGADFGPDVPLREVDAELARQAAAIRGDDPAPLRHARMSNLIVYCGDPGEADRVCGLIPEIVDRHPARVLLLIADAEGGAGEVTASVRVRRVGEGGRNVSEQITLRAGGRGADRLPFAVRGLVIGDLPTNLWWASAEPPPLAGPILRDLAESAQQVIYDSLGWRDPHHGVAATSPWLDRTERDPGAGRWRVASDINWRRLKTWRRVLAQGLDPAVAPGLLDEASEILIEHGPHAVTQAWHLASWLASRLRWSYRANKLKPGVEIAFQFLAPHGPVRLRIDRLPEGPPAIRRVRVARGFEGQDGGVEFTADPDGRLAITPLNGECCADRTVMGRDQEIAELIGRQLSDREPDPIFRQSMRVAHVLAQHVPFH
ncbi:glucose-6-phosphate dehydrogenase assembly protein OpcA [Tundrisphaera sp. TA3]|uniref:glucose-6-phosphate dehydrogenase assembly protein OpcA n=1 Tax=Tundrisphaera sp. TA3 TaxID=3435775 RepID=UPI003EBF0721